MTDKNTYNTLNQKKRTFGWVELSILDMLKLGPIREKQTVLAYQLGTTQQVVSEAAKRLEMAGLIIREGRRDKTMSLRGGENE